MIYKIIDKIPAGYRAVTITLSPTKSIEGWLQAGTSVDVYWISNVNKKPSSSLINSTTNKKPNSTSPKTGDAGILGYIGLAGIATSVLSRINRRKKD